MNAKRIDEIKAQMGQKTDEELLAIWGKNDRVEWKDDAFEAIRQVLTERKVTVPAQASATAEIKTPEATKGPVGWRFARFFAALLFAFFCGVASLGLAQFVSGLYLNGCVALTLGTVLALACAVSVRWLSRSSFPSASAETHSRMMKVVASVAVVYFALFLALKSPSETTWGLISFVGYVVVGLGGIWMLVRSRRFAWQKYAVVGVGIAALTLPIYIPQMKFARGAMWADDHETAFRSLIQEAQSANMGNENELQEVVGHVIDLRVLQDVKGPMIALLAKNADQSRPSLLRMSPVCVGLPKHLRANSPADVHAVLIHGEPAVFRGATPQRHELVSPILVYSWPDRKLLGSGRLLLGDMDWGISRGEAYQKIAQSIGQTARTGQ